MLELVRWIIAYVIVPGTLFIMLMAAVIVAFRAPQSQRLSAAAGVVGGLIAFGLYFSTTFEGTDAAAKAGLAKPQEAPWMIGIGGFVIGFAALFVIQRIRLRHGMLGLFTLFLTATSMIALRGYFYESPYRDVAVQFAFGSLFGMFLYVVLFAQHIQKTFRRSEPIAQ
ncbi:hypothetical protein [Nocardia crassostreae]|uniref:hypothetical protein n=1 Tax=Nocardia crassostreae TaxID=53428 RepID=UPI00082EEDDB|nr:hypothetical protein [Nocardia crassostreae]